MDFDDSKEMVHNWRRDCLASHTASLPEVQKAQTSSLSPPPAAAQASSPSPPPAAALAAALKNGLPTGGHFPSHEQNMDAEAQKSIEETTLGVWIIRDPTATEYMVGIVINGEIVLRDLDNVPLATAMLLGLFYALNLNYPSKLRYTFKVMQKVIMEIDPNKLSKKVPSFNKSDTSPEAPVFAHH